MLDSEKRSKICVKTKSSSIFETYIYIYIFFFHRKYMRARWTHSQLLFHSFSGIGRNG